MDLHNIVPRLSPHSVLRLPVVVILCADPDAVRRLMLLAYEMGFINGDYVFINIDLFSRFVYCPAHIFPIIILAFIWMSRDSSCIHLQAEVSRTDLKVRNLLLNSCPSLISALLTVGKVANIFCL